MNEIMLEREIFWAVHNDLPREGPGDDDSTLRAFSMMKGLPDSPRVLDIMGVDRVEERTLA